MKRYRIKVEKCVGELDKYFPQVKEGLFGEWKGLYYPSKNSLYVATNYGGTYFNYKLEAEKLIYSYRCQEENQKVNTSYIKIK